jgi:hypothetical protein
MHPNDGTQHHTIRGAARAWLEANPNNDPFFLVRKLENVITTPQAKW